MGFFEAIIAFTAIVATFGAPVVVVKEILSYRERRRRHELEASGRGGNPRELEALKVERKLLVERIENLESIVCSVDLELNQKLSRLIDEQRMLESRPGAGAGSGSGAGTGTGTGTGNGTGAGTGMGAGPSAALAATTPTPPGLDRTMTQMAQRPRSATSGSHPVAGQLTVGDVLANRYRVERLLGRGGMGAVYLAHDEVLHDLVALKVISSAFAADEVDLVERFRREAAAARRVSSPNVIRIHDLGEARPGLLYISMEYFPGRTLAEVMTARGLVPITDCIDLIGQICTGLAAAHDAGVIHRDLKPQNVLVGERNAVKLIDFGLAKATSGGNATATGVLMGTPHYMSPEQVRGKHVDAASDIYALGALAYHLVTGRPPFHGDNAIAVGFAHCTDIPAPPRSLRPDVPPGLDAVILKALAKAPAERPRSAADVRTGLSA